MQRPKILWAQLGISIFLIALVSGGAAGKSGRNFAGYCRITDLGDEEATVRVAIAVRVFNYTGADVNGATVLLEDSLPPPKPFGSFVNVSIPQQGSTLLKGEFTVTRQEHERWEKRGAPRLVIEVKAADGNRLRQTVELLRMRGYGEE